MRALRNAVINHREGQALPVLRSSRHRQDHLGAHPRQGAQLRATRSTASRAASASRASPVERGTSYDVHELDAASNNGVEAMRDLIEKASLGTPGRHKVYILDEVHMLSKAAEAALLKTLEEPPPHVVFVLATTDPQKVSETIRSRTQHLQFHLLPMDDARASTSAGSPPTPASRSARRRSSRCCTQGGGSARDTLSALELVASTGGDGTSNVVPYDEFVEALIESRSRPSAHRGRARRPAGPRPTDARPRTSFGHLRDCFLSLMAPELVQLPDRIGRRSSPSRPQRLGAAALVRAMERLGEMLVEMRHAPDPRLLLEVATGAVDRTTAAPTTLGASMARLDRLEQPARRRRSRRRRHRRPPGRRSIRRPVVPRSAAVSARDAPPDARSAPPAAGRRPRSAPGRRRRAPRRPSPLRPRLRRRPSTAEPAARRRAAAPRRAGARQPVPSGSGDSITAVMAWASDGHAVVEADGPRDLLGPATFVGAARRRAHARGCRTQPHRGKCEQHRADCREGPQRDRRDGHHGRARRWRWRSRNVARRARGDDECRHPVGPGRPRQSGRVADLSSVSSTGAFATSLPSRSRTCRPTTTTSTSTISSMPRPRSVKTPIDRLAEAFPGSELIDEPALMAGHLHRRRSRS